MRISAKHDPVLWAARLLGVELFPWQQQFIRAQAAALLDPANATIGSAVTGCCGRQAGKTRVDAVSLLWYADTFSHTKQMVVAPIAPQSKWIWSDCCDVLRESVLSEVRDIEIKQSDYPSIVIRPPSGAASTITFRSVGNDGGRLRAPHANRIFGDEAARIAGSVFQSDLLPMMSAQQHRQLVMTSTPLFAGDYFHTNWLRGQDPTEPNMKSFHYPSTANPMITAELLESYRKGMTDEAFQVEFLAVWVDGAGCYFPWELITRCTDSGIRPGAAPQHRYVIGWDEAQTRDRSGVCVLDVTASDPRLDPWQAVEVLNVAPKQEDWPVQVAHVAALSRQYGKAHVVLDVTRQPALASMLKQEGVHVEGFTFGGSPTKKAALLDALKALMEQGALRLPPDEELERELRFYRRDVSEGGHITLGAPTRAGHYDDLVTALALAVHAAPKKRLFVAGFVDLDKKRGALKGHRLQQDWRSSQPNAWEAMLEQLDRPHRAGNHD